jgi:hypothetical protein
MDAHRLTNGIDTHTPGPWTIGHDEGLLPGRVAIHSDEHGDLAQVVWQMEDDKTLGQNSPTPLANARTLQQG